MRVAVKLTLTVWIPCKQAMPQELPSDNTAAPQILSEQENTEVWERQNFLLGCVEMERITDDIIVPVFQKLTGAFRKVFPDADLILMDCESPLDEQLYNVGVRLSFQYGVAEVEISIVADPSDSTFLLSTDGVTSEPITHEFKYYEIIPRVLDKIFADQIDEHFSDVPFKPINNANDQQFATYTPPFRVQYDDNGTISDVATTKTLVEAANMGSTFAKMFRNEKAITILDSKNNVIC